MDVAQYILCFVARYVNILFRKRTITTFSMSSAFETHISYKVHGAYAKWDFLQDLMSWSTYLLYPRRITYKKCVPYSKYNFFAQNLFLVHPNVCHQRLVRHFPTFVNDKFLCKFWPTPKFDGLRFQPQISIQMGIFRAV